MATSGPGGIHLLNGLYDAKCDGQPVLAITGHTFHDLIGTHYQQDVDLDKLFMDVAVYNERIMGPAHVENVVDEAIKTALARRGVAHITIPKDIQEWTASEAPRSKANIADHSGDIFAAASPAAADANVAEGGRHHQRRHRRWPSWPAAAASKRRSEVLASWPRRSAAPIVKPLLGKARGARRQPLHDRRHRPAGHGALAGRHAGLRHAPHPRQQLPLRGVLAQARPGQVRADRPRRRAHRPAPSRPTFGLVGDCQRVLEALLPLIQRKTGPQLPGDGPEGHEGVERADGRARPRARTSR